MLSFYRSLIYKRHAFALTSILFLVISSIGLKDLKNISGYWIFFDESDENWAKLNEKEDVFSEDNDIIYVIESRSKDIFTSSNLTSVEKLTEKSWQIPNSVRINSLTNFQHTEASEDDLSVNFLYESATKTDPEIVRTIALSRPELVNALVGKKGESTVVQAKMIFSDDPVERVVQRNESVNHARGIAAEIEAENPDLKIHLVGRSLINQTLDERSHRDVITLTPIMMLLIIGFMYFFTRSISATTACFITLLLCVISTHGFMGWVGFGINQVNSQISVIILAIAIGNCIHLLSSYAEELKDPVHVDKKDALVRAISKNAKAITITNFTTIIGFVCLNFSDAPPFRELGNLAAYALTLVFILTFTIFPSLILLFRSTPVQRSVVTTIFGSLVSFLLIKKKLYLILVILVSTAVSGMAFLNTINDEIIKYFSPTDPFRVGASYLQSTVTGFDTIDIVLDTNNENGIYDTNFLSRVEKLESWLYEQPGVTHVSSIVPIFKRLNFNMNSDNPDFYRLPSSNEEAAQYLLLYEMSLPYGLGTDNLINLDKSSTLLTLAVENATTPHLIDLHKRTEEYLSIQFPEATTNVSSVSLVFAHIGHNSINSMLFGSLVALLLISVSIGVFYRNAKFVWFSIPSNSLPALVMFGLWWILVGEIDMPSAIVFSVTLGIIVDDTIHILSRYHYAKETLNLNTDNAIIHAFNEIGGAILSTSIILATGFFVLAFSDFTVNQHFGMMCGATIIVAFILDVTLLPLLISIFDKEPAQQEIAETASGKSCRNSMIDNGNG